MNWLRRILRSLWVRPDADLVVYDRLGRVVSDPTEKAALLDEMYGKRAQIYGADGSLIADSRPD